MTRSRRGKKNPQFHTSVFSPSSEPWFCVAMFAFQLVADALGVPLAEGKARWDQAQARLKRQQQQLPPTTRTKPPGARQPTPTLAADFAAKALAQVLKEPLKDFFEKDEKLAWLREKVQEAGGDPKTVDAEVQQLLAEKAQREADALSLVLPGLQTGGTAMALRTAREGTEVMGSVFDYLRWLGLSDASAEWCHWLADEFHQHERVHASNANGEILRYAEKVFPGQHSATPITNFPGFRLLTKLCLHKSKIAQGMYDQALVLLGQVSVGDQRLHEVLDANAASSSGEARAFVLGTEEAKVQKSAKVAKTAPLDLEAFERQCLEDDSLDPEVAARRLAKLALARQYRDTAGQQFAIIKRQKIADVEKYEAETRAAKEKFEAETKAAQEAAVEKIHAERDKIQAERDKIQAERDETQVERAAIQARRQQVEDTAKAEREERERQRVHAAELAAEKRKAEIREAAARGLIAQAAAEEMLGEARQTLILRLEDWIRTRCGCHAASACSAVLSRKFNEAVEAGRHVKPASHRNEAGRWMHFAEHDGPLLAQLHQEIHDRRNGVSAGQERLSFARA